MGEFIKGLFDLKKIPVPIVSFIAFVTGILLFVPNEYLKRFKFELFIKNYGQYIGIVFISCVGLLLVSLIMTIIKSISDGNEVRAFEKKILTHLESLTFNEIVVLREFILQNSDTILLPWLDVTVISLENKFIIYKASNHSRTVDLWAFFTKLEIKKFLNPSLLQLPNTEEISAEQKFKILNERPHWAK